VKIARLLVKLKAHSKEIQTLETVHPDGTRTYVFSSIYPFPRIPEPVWYVIVVKPGQEDIDDREIEAMLRHLWMYQLDLLPRKAPARIPTIAASEHARTPHSTPKKK